MVVVKYKGVLMTEAKAKKLAESEMKAIKKKAAVIPDDGKPKDEKTK